MIRADFQRTLSPYDSAAAKPSRWYFRLHIDPILVGLLTVVIVYGLVVLRSAVDGSEGLSMQIQRYAVAYVALIVAAQIPPHFYLRISPLVYVVGMLLLLLVLLASQSKGPSAGLKFRAFRFQPSELMKLAVPMAVAWYLQKRSLPPSLKYTTACLVIMTLPALLIGRQPDLGTSILVFVSGIFGSAVGGTALAFGPVGRPCD